MNDSIQTSVETVMMRDVRTVEPGCLLGVAARSMLDLNLTCLIVDLQDPSKGMGIVTQKDIIGLLFDGAVDLESTTVGEVMSHPTVGLSPHWSLETAVSMMRMMGVRRAPVMDGERLVGLLSFTDVFRHVLRSTGGANK